MLSRLLALALLGGASSVSADSAGSRTVQVLIGLGRGFGLGVVEQCVDDGISIGDDLDNAVKAFEAKKPLEGLKEIGEALVVLPDAAQKCNATRVVIESVIDALEQFKSPKAFAYHVGKDLLVNGKDIYTNMKSATDAWGESPTPDYENFGYYVGLSLKELIIGQEQQKLLLKKKFLGLGLQNTAETLRFDPKKDGADIATGLLKGFGLDVAEGCVTDGTDVFTEAEAAFKAFEAHDARAGIKELYEMAKTLPAAAAQCKASEAQIKKLV